MDGYRFVRQAVSVEEAQKQVLSCVQRLPVETAALSDSFGRRLAVSVRASHPLPHFRRSGVDGYAVRSEDVQSASASCPVRLDVIECIPAGIAPARAVKPGQAARIMTGAVVPEGADAVVMLEMTDALEPREDVGVKKIVRAGENVTPVGQEAAAGELLLTEGTLIGAGEAAILAAFGCYEVSVARRPRVAVFAAGSELLEVSQELSPGKIRNSNSYMVACQIQQAGGIPFIQPSLPDEVDTALDALLQAMDEYDVLITTGGVSVGDKDVLAQLFSCWDGELLFNKIRMRPGSPTSAGLLRGKPLFALSGNPGACYVGFELLVKPYLLAAAGCQHPLPACGHAVLDTDYAKGSAYPRYVRGRVYEEGGQLKAGPVGQDKSSIMVSIKEANCLIHIPAGGRGAAQGSLIQFFPLVQ